MNCKEKFIQISENIKQGSTRYKRDKTFESLKEDVKRYGQKCSKILADYLEIRIEYIAGNFTLTYTLDSLNDILEKSFDKITDWEQIHILSFISMLNFKNEPIEINFERRNKILELADKNNYEIEALTILVSWLFTRVTLKQGYESEKLIDEIDRRFNNLSDTNKNDLRLAETQSRFLSHKATILFQKIKKKDEKNSSMINNGNRYYEEAVQLMLSDDHRRVNTLTEWAERLTVLFDEGFYEDSKYIENIFYRALTGLGSHYCDPCIAFYHQVKSSYLFSKGNKILPFNKIDSLKVHNEALIECNESIKYYKRIGHPYIKEPLYLSEKITRKINMIETSKKIFLSHKSNDKSIVRRFYNLLELLGFEPWLDESSMPPNDSLYRGIYEGMKESCACIFFITENFKDENYIKEEINLAIQLQIDKGEDLFRIIPIVMGSDITVPDIIKKRTRYKTFVNELDAFSYILKWLPVKVGTVVPRNYDELL